MAEKRSHESFYRRLIFLLARGLERGAKQGEVEEKARERERERGGRESGKGSSRVRGWRRTRKTSGRRSIGKVGGVSCLLDFGPNSRLRSQPLPCSVCSVSRAPTTRNRPRERERGREGGRELPGRSNDAAKRLLILYSVTLFAKFSRYYRPFDCDYGRCSRMLASLCGEDLLFDGVARMVDRRGESLTVEWRVGFETAII